MTSQQSSSNLNTNAEIPSEIANAPRLAIEEKGDGDRLALEGDHFENHHSAFADFHEGYVRHYIALADQKAGWSFAITSAVAAFVLTNESSREVLFGASWSAEFVLTFTSLLFLMSSSACSFLAIAPRLRIRSGEGIVFFMDVAARRDSRSYALDLARLSEDDLTEARLKHCYDTSKVCFEKYTFLAKSLFLGAVGLVNSLFALSLVWSAA